jgi:cation diffusion facilitator CzcD-associated flavoprotein CzcO
VEALQVSVTRPLGLAEPRHHIVIVGAGAGGESARATLLAAGITNFVMLDEEAGASPDSRLRPGHEVRTSRFDDDTDTWLLTMADGEMFRARVVITTDQPVHIPWLPDIAGRDEFLGESLHAAAWDPDFHPSGKHVAVVGTDATAGYHIGRLAEIAASVTVFAHAPRRVVTDVALWPTRAKRWLRRHAHPTADRPAVRFARSPIGAVTSSGIRTIDGADHRVDAIVYGTGYAIPGDVADETLVGAGEMTIRQAWHDGMEPFCGVAVHGLPNYFFIAGPDTDAQARYIAECLKLMQRTISSRIEVRGSSQQVFNERAQLKPAQPPPPASAFDLSSSAPAGDDTYNGAAILEIAGTRHPVRVRLTGHLDPIDGRYHWQGTLFGSPSQPLHDEVLKQARTATLTVGQRSAPARIVERTPWGTHSVAGVGAPPYSLSDR